MVQTTLKVDGMACSMCEAHVNEAVRKAFPGVKKVTSSHKKGETVILSEEAPDEAALRAAVDATGYRVTGVASGPAAKKGFSLFGR